MINYIYFFKKIIWLIGWSDWENITIQVHNTCPSYTILRSNHWIWNLTIGFEECNERLILVNYSHNQTIEFREMCGQILVKVGQI